MVFRRILLILTACALFAGVGVAHAQPASKDPEWPSNIGWQGCPAPIWPKKLAEGAPGYGSRVLLVGDSLTRNSRIDLKEQLTASGWTPTFRCWGGQTVQWGLAQIKRAKELNQLPSRIVIGLGTNNKYDSPESFTANVKKIMDEVGPNREVYWVNLWLDVKKDPRMKVYTRLNKALNQLDEQFPNMQVIDWYTQLVDYTKDHALATTYDGIHYYAKGNKMRAVAITEALNASVSNARNTQR